MNYLLNAASNKRLFLFEKGEKNMGLPHPNSPNGCWQRHGYRSELPPGRPQARCRNVYAPNGTLVLVAADYEKQFDYCRDQGLLLPACEVERVL